MVLAACELLQTPLTDDQRVLVSQIIFDALRTLLQAHQEIGPLAASATYSGQRTPLQDQEAFDYIDRAKEISQQLLAEPTRCVQIMERVCP
jgi:hypothetical protein